MQQHGAVENTVVVTMNIPNGDDWRWLPQLNVVALAPHLDEAGRERALDEAHAMWRAEWIDISA